MVVPPSKSCYQDGLVGFFLRGLIKNTIFMGSKEQKGLELYFF